MVGYFRIGEKTGAKIGNKKAGVRIGEKIMKRIMNLIGETKMVKWTWISENILEWKLVEWNSVLKR